MAATATYKCVKCGNPFTARTADRKRGWARYCSKSCKAVKQEAKTGQHRAYQQRQDGEPTFNNAHQYHDDMGTP
jgi:hypothetical protein